MTTETAPRIRVLPKALAEKIAAGEVVERPASVLKELLENALDAGASRLTVEVSGAGVECLRVVDDGEGMTPEECRLAFGRHATSKLARLEELDDLATLGFRGEALNAIAAVSRVALASTREGRGWKVELAGGELERELEAPPVKGTSIEVKDLFYNVPARREFLKSEGSERAQLARVVEEVALARPGLSLTYRSEGKLVHRLGPVEGEGALETRVGEVLGVRFAEDLIPVAVERDELKVRGLVSHPDRLAGARSSQYWFVNGRPVQARVLQQALYKLYEDRGRKHPACVLFLELPGERVDVNVHPRKAEVRFKDEGLVFQVLAAAVGRALTLARQPAPLASDAPPPPLRALGKPRPLLKFPRERLAEPPAPAPLLAREAAPAYAPKPQQPELAPERTAEDPAWWTPPFRFLGQLEESYLLFEAAGGLLVVDQHAAAERVRFERYMKQAAKGRPAAQKMMFPVEVEFPASQFEVLKCLLEPLAEAGFEVELSGERALRVLAAPEAFPLDPEGLKELMEKLGESLDPSDAAGQVLKEKIATAACKESVKAHDRLGPQEARRLLDELKGCEAPKCPHGRPALLSLNRAELARRFKRPGPPPKD